MITRDEVHDIATEVVRACRASLDNELHQIRQVVNENVWTEGRAEEIAEKAADLAVKKITDGFYMGVGKKTVTALGAAVVATVIILRDQVKSLFGIK